MDSFVQPFNTHLPVQCCKTIFFQLICVNVLISSKDMPPSPWLVVIPVPFALCIYLAQHFFLCVCSHWIQTTLTLTLNAMFSDTSNHLPVHLCSLLFKYVFTYDHSICSFHVVDDVGWQNSSLLPEGTVWHLGKHAQLISCEELDKWTSATLMSVSQTV